ncbi:acyl-CoA dehydrogenase family protein [Rhodococcus qingshengii]|uniref:acyl-CoA dehydrogenase family protein n=1 Tax=Rhodococcus qingshengii TaxID=334542 RepID=UPI0010A66159|nr:acyl-CoA dehydrogenase family protein [Rhodococcus qingshengii]THJ64712.1 acyl-CoA dehydrogenase [Rhodococcus qingshengii]
MTSDVARDKLRQEVQAWLSEHWKGVDDQQWRLDVVLAGWAVPTFPDDAYGRGLSTVLAGVVGAEFEAVGAPRACQDLGISAVHGWVRMVGMAVARFGGAQLKETFLRDLLVGDADNGVALYSEPSAGSDLASLQTKATLNGDHWLVNGQKVWSSSAADSTWGVLLARTDDTVPKHQGITFFIIPMQQPGIHISPIKQITGDSEFSEVFLTDARVPVENIVGELNGGWSVLQEVLAAEREWLGAYLEAGNRPGIAADELDRSDMISSEGAEDLIDAARKAGRADDSSVRQSIAQLHTLRLVHRWNNERLMSGEGGSSPVAAAALGKLASSRILHATGRFKAQMLGPEAMMYGSDNRSGESVNREVMNAFINSVGGGSDQIQRNIIGERLLGFPRGHAPDRGVAFKDIKKSLS